MSEIGDRITELGEQTKATIQRHTDSIAAEIDRHVKTVRNLVASSQLTDEAARNLITSMQQQMAAMNDGAHASLMSQSEEMNRALGSPAAPPAT